MITGIRERVVWKRIKALTRSTISDYLLPFSCDRSTARSRVCGIWDAAVLAVCEAEMSRCTWITVFWNILCIFESCGGIFNTADLEFKRETIIPCLSPKCLAQVFFFFFFPPFPTPFLILLGPWYTKQGFSVVIILSILAGHTQILMKSPYPGQSSSSQKALEFHLPFKEKRFKAVWGGMTSMFEKSALADYLIPCTRGNKKLIVTGTALTQRRVGQNMTP